MVEPTGADAQEKQTAQPKDISTVEGEAPPPAASGPHANSSEAVRFYTEALKEIARKHGIET